MNIDKLQDAPGVYAVQLPDGVVKFGQSKTVKSRVRTHVRTLRSYGVPVLDVAAVYVNHCEDAEKDLFARLTAAGYQRSSNSRESYLIPWDVATGMLSTPVPVGKKVLGIPAMDSRSMYPGLLRCAACGEPDTHVRDVVWFMRTPYEDGVTGEYRTHAPGPLNSVRKYESLVNRSSRRDSVAIVYNCENCPAVSATFFEQHKGGTHLLTEVIGSLNEWEVPA